MADQTVHVADHLACRDLCLYEDRGEGVVDVFFFRVECNALNVARVPYSRVDQRGECFDVEIVLVHTVVPFFIKDLILIFPADSIAHLCSEIK